MMRVTVLLALAVALSSSCRLELVETNPNYANSSLHIRRVADAWVDLFSHAQTTIDMESLYVILSEGGGSKSAGKVVLKSLLTALARGVKVRIVVPWPSLSDNGQIDLDTLTAAGAIVGKVNWQNSTGVPGLAHAKYIVVDAMHTYIGSADFSQPALSMVKQVGVVAWNCSTIAKDAARVFAQFFSIANGAKAPQTWPQDLSALTNSTHPDFESGSFLAVSPPTFDSEFRTSDGDAILRVIEGATTYLKLSTMDYYTWSLYQKKPFKWTAIDDAIRAAAKRGVVVQALFGWWSNSPRQQIKAWKSLNDVPNCSVRILVVGKDSVAHEKYVVSDMGSYVTSNNFVPDYFLSGTGGLSISMPPKAVPISALFDRDWNSKYAIPLEKFNFNGTAVFS